MLCFREVNSSVLASNGLIKYIFPDAPEIEVNTQVLFDEPEVEKSKIILRKRLFEDFVQGEPFVFGICSIALHLLLLMTCPQ